MSMSSMWKRFTSLSPVEPFQMCLQTWPDSHGQGAKSLGRSRAEISGALKPTGHGTACLLLWGASQNVVLLDYSPPIIMPKYTAISSYIYNKLYLFGGLEHFLFFRILGIILSTDWYWFRGVETTNQLTQFKNIIIIYGSIILYHAKADLSDLRKRLEAEQSSRSAALGPWGSPMVTMCSIYNMYGAYIYIYIYT